MSQSGRVSRCGGGRVRRLLVTWMWRGEEQDVSLRNGTQTSIWREGTLLETPKCCIIVGLWPTISTAQGLFEEQNQTVICSQLKEEKHNETVPLVIKRPDNQTCCSVTFCWSLCHDHLISYWRSCLQNTFGYEIFQLCSNGGGKKVNFITWTPLKSIRWKSTC